MTNKNSNSKPQCSLDLQLYLFTTSLHKVGNIWDKGLEGAGSKQLAKTKNSQLEVSIANFSPTWDTETVNEKAGEDWKGTSGVSWRWRRFPAVRASQLLL